MRERGRLNRLTIPVLLCVTLMMVSALRVVFAVPGMETLRLNVDVFTGMILMSGSGSHCDKMNEASADGDTTYLYSQSGGFSYDLSDLPDIPSGYTISSVTVYVVARRWFDPPAYYDFRILIKTHNTIIPDPINITTDNIAATENRATYSKTWTSTPFTNSPWTTGEVNDRVVGVQGAYGNTYVGVTQLYVEVTTTPELVISFSPGGPILIFAACATGARCL